MANILWGHSFEVDNKHSVLLEFSKNLTSTAENSIKKIINIGRKKESGWGIKATEFPIKEMKKVCKETGKFVVDKGIIAIEPDWKAFLTERLNYVKQVSELFWAQDKLNLNISSEEARQKSQMAYQQELSNSEGLGFGIISSSLTAHLLYAWQSSRKEQENIRNAERIADEVYKANNPFAKADALTNSFYDTYIEKRLIDSLTEFYGALEYLVYEKSNNLELFHNNNCNVNTTKTSYNEIDDNRRYVLESFSSNIFDGDIVVFAICNNLIDDNFIEFFKTAPNLLHINAQNSIEDYLKKEKQKAKEHKEEVLNEKILNIISRFKSELIIHLCTIKIRNIRCSNSTILNHSHGF